MAGVMGLLQANEVIKLVAGIGEPLIGRLLYDSLVRFTELKVKRDQCRCAGERARDPRVRDGEVPRLRSVLRRHGRRLGAGSLPLRWRR